MSADVRIGISGWTYKPWRGAFYPKGLPHKKELAHASSVFRSIEINGTFYGLQRPEVFARWAGETPDDFIFAVKGSRFITHMKRLKDPERPLARFMAQGVELLGRKLGPILWQLPPNFRFDPERLEAFFLQLPRPLRHALEIRHESFRDPAFVALLRKHDVALVCADTVDWPLLMDLTSDFVYVRLHGSTELYRSGYGPADIERWAKRVEAWRDGKPMTDGTFASSEAPRRTKRDVYVYFDNTDKLQAPRDALALMHRLGQS